jgi:hypothetical protein
LTAVGVLRPAPAVDAAEMRRLPPVHRLLESKEATALCAKYRRALVVQALREEFTDRVRQPDPATMSAQKCWAPRSSRACRHALQTSRGMLDLVDVPGHE